MPHTPGPWFVGKLLPEDDYGESITVGPMEKDCHYEDTIAEVWNDNHDATANANLIAAAPDLLEACKAFLSNMRKYGHQGKADRLMMNAIRKAQGGVI